MRRKLWKLILAVLLLVAALALGNVQAAEDSFDAENFKGLVLTTSVGSDQASVKLYSGYAQTSSKLMTPVYTEQTADGGMAYYYQVTSGGKYRYVSRHPSNYSRYIMSQCIYISSQEAGMKTVMDVTPAKRSTAGWDTSSTVYIYSDEVLARKPSDASLWPEYADVFTTPAFTNPRNPHQQTTQTEMMDFINGMDTEEDDMYVYILGQSGGKAFDIPLVVFTSVDLSGADTLEEAAALIRADSEKNGKVTVHYQAQIHGYETASGEGAMAMIQRLDGSYGQGLLDNMNIYVIPRLSPYGAYKSMRNVWLDDSSTIDPNGDFMRLRTVETQLRQKAMNLFDPDVAMDGHEFVLSKESASEGVHDLYLAAHYLPSHTEEFQQLSKTVAANVMDKARENGLTPRWYSDVVNNARASVGSANMAYRGILHFLMETQGSDSGLTNYERRVVGQVTVATSVFEYVNNNAAEVKRIIREQKAAIVEAGKTYEETDQVVLLYEEVLDPELCMPGKNINLATGELTDTTFEAWVWEKVVRARTAPTAYVIPAGAAYTENVLKLMDMQGISYEFIPAGSGIWLQQYKAVTYNDSGRVIEAELTEEAVFAFPNGAYMFSMAQVNANILALLMEPDVTQNTTNTLVQAGTVPVAEGMIPIYRYIRDLNADGSIDYTAMPDAPAGQVSYTVYLKQSATDETADGYSQENPVNTVAEAYAQLDKLMATAPAGTTGKVVLLDMYTFPSGRQALPAHSYPVEITGNTATCGLSHPGDGGEDQNIIAFSGDTTLTNMKLVARGNTDHNYISACGHKLVIGKGVTGEKNTKGRYFKLCGGDYRGTFASTDVTVLSGDWYMLYGGNFASGTISGDVSLKVKDANVTATIEATYRCTIKGDVYMEIRNVTGEGNVYGGAASSGKVYGDVTLVLGENLQKAYVYACASNSTFSGHFTVIADGVDLNATTIRGRGGSTTTLVPATLILNAGNLADVADTFVCREDATIILGCDQTVPATLASCNLDLNGFDAVVDAAEGATVTVWDSQTDDYTVEDKYGYGVLTATGNVVAKEGYIAAAGGFHKFGGQYISSVSLRPGNAGIYYTATFLADEVLLSALETGVAVSLTDMPGADFATDADTLYTKGTTGVLVNNILKGDADDADRAIMDIYAASYVKLPDGTVLVSENEVAYSLYDILLLLQTQNEEAFQSFITNHNIDSWF